MDAAGSVSRGLDSGFVHAGLPANSSRAHQIGRRARAPATIMKPDANLAPDNRRRGFWWLFVTQFQGAFSDNVLKNLVIFMIIGMNVPLGEKHKIGELVGALFSLPFIVFSMAGG